MNRRSLGIVCLVAALAGLIVSGVGMMGKFEHDALWALQLAFGAMLGCGGMLAGGYCLFTARLSPTAPSSGKNPPAAQFDPESLHDDTLSSIAHALGTIELSLAQNCEPDSLDKAAAARQAVLKRIVEGRGTKPHA